MDNEKKLRLLEDVFELGQGELSPEMVLDDLDDWDSMTKLSLIVMVEEEFGKVLQSGTIRGFKTVADIMERMS